MGAGIELRGADEIAHVLQDDQIQVLLAQGLEPLVHHGGVQVAEPASCELRRAHSCLGHTLGIHAGVEVRLDDPDAPLIAQNADRLQDQMCLARPGRGHEIEQERALIAEPLSDGSGFFGVLREHPFLDLDQLNPAHIRPPPDWPRCIPCPKSGPRAPRRRPDSSDSPPRSIRICGRTPGK